VKIFSLISQLVWKKLGLQILDSVLPPEGAGEINRSSVLCLLPGPLISGIFLKMLSGY